MASCRCGRFNKFTLGAERVHAALMNILCGKLWRARDIISLSSYRLVNELVWYHQAALSPVCYAFGSHILYVLTHIGQSGRKGRRRLWTAPQSQSLCLSLLSKHAPLEIYIPNYEPERKWAGARRIRLRNVNCEILVQTRKTSMKLISFVSLIKAAEIEVWSAIDGF